MTSRASRHAPRRDAFTQGVLLFVSVLVIGCVGMFSFIPYLVRAATPPTYIQEAETAWTTTTSPKSTASFSVQAGDVLVAYTMAEHASSTNINISDNTGGALTWTARVLENGGTSNRSYVRMWTTTVDTNRTMTVTFTRTAGSPAPRFGGNVLTFRGSSGIGATSSTNNGTGSAAPTLNITTTQANSVIVVANADRNAVDGALRAWRTNAGIFAERTYSRTAGAYTVYGGNHADSGALNTYAVGLSSPSGQRYVIGAIEVLGMSSPPSVTTSAASGVTTNSATLNGDITATGGANATVRGFAYSTTANLTTSVSTTTENGSFGTGAYTGSASSLSPNTTYYVRAYATNSGGTGYGSIQNFTTAGNSPSVTTNAASAVTEDSATLNGNIGDTGGANATTRGFAWGLSATLGSGTATTTENGSFGIGAFLSNLSTLAEDTTYYFRAYATNPNGTGFGSIQNFTTEGSSPPPPPPPPGGSAGIITGWAWEGEEDGGFVGGVGWVSLHCSTDPAGCGGAAGNWGLAVAADGMISGEAWSDNVGWIQAYESPIGCPVSPCEAKIRSDGLFEGWLKAFGADGNGWDGWISLADTNTGDGFDYGIAQSGTSLLGYAWGSDVVGWLAFTDAETTFVPCTQTFQCVDATHRDDLCTPVNENEYCGDGNICSTGLCTPPGTATGELILSPSLVPTGDSVEVSWTVVDTTSCRVFSSAGDEWWGDESDGPLLSLPILETTLFTLECANVFGEATTTIDTVYAVVVPTWVER